MTPIEILLRVAFLAIFLSFAAVMSHYQRRAKHVGKNLRERTQAHNENEVPALIAIRTILGIPWYIGVFLWLFAPAWIEWAALPLTMWLSWSGVLIGVSAVGLNIWSHQTLYRELGDDFNPVLRLQNVPRLVTSGPYRWVRHPIYLAFLLMMVATALITANWLIGVTGIGLILSVILVRTQEEEKRLIAQFGDNYTTYQKQAGAYVPHLGSGER